MDWNAYVKLTFEEIRLAGAGSPQVARRLEDMLRDLRSAAPPDRQAVLDDELELLHPAVHDRYREPGDVLLALEPDRQGLGIGAGPTPSGVTRVMPDD